MVKRKTKSKSPKRKGTKRGGRPRGSKGDKLKMTVNELIKQGDQDMERFRNVRKTLMNDAKLLDRKFLVQKKVLMSMTDRQDRIETKFEDLATEISDGKSEIRDALNRMIKGKLSDTFTKDDLERDSVMEIDATKVNDLDLEDDIIDDLMSNRKLVVRTGLKQILAKAKSKAQAIEKKLEQREDRASGKEDETMLVKEAQSDYKEAKREIARALKSRLRQVVKKVLKQEENVAKAQTGIKAKGTKSVKASIKALTDLLTKGSSGSIFVGTLTKDKVKTPLDNLKSALSEQNKALKKLRTQFSNTYSGDF